MRGIRSAISRYRTWKICIESWSNSTVFSRCRNTYNYIIDGKCLFKVVFPISIECIFRNFLRSERTCGTATVKLTGFVLVELIVYVEY